MVAVAKHDDEIERMTKAGRSLKEISAAVGIGTRAVSRRRKALGLSKPYRLAQLPPLEDRLVQAAKLFEGGASQQEVSKTLNISTKVLKREFPGMAWSRQESGAWSQVVQTEKALFNGKGYSSRTQRSGAGSHAA